MRRKKKQFPKLFCITAVCLLLLCGYAVFGNLPNHTKNVELLQTVPSPDGTKTVFVYRYNGSPTVCYAVLCKVAGRGVIDRPFYWLYHAEDAAVIWENGDRVRIDPVPVDEDCALREAVTLDVRGEWYDFRKGIGGFGRDENGKVFLHKWWRE